MFVFFWQRSVKGMPRAATDFEYNIKKFDITRMDRSRSCIFIGGSGTGKSQLVTSVLHANRDIPAGIVMSGTEAGDPYWSRFVPDLFIYDDWHPEKLEDLIDIQRKAKRGVEAIEAEIDYCKRNGRHDDLKRLTLQKQRKMLAMRKFVIIDDLMFKGGISRNDTIRKLFMNGRHWGILACLTIQYCMSLDIALRGNAGYVFICRENIISYRKKIYESFLGMLPSFAVFEKVMDACTQNFECLVLDRTSRSTKVEECLFWYKAAPRYDFRIGSPKLWAYHRTHYDQNHEERAMKENKAKRESGVVRKKG